MTARLVTFFAVGVLAVLLAYGRSSQTQANFPTLAAYDYKVELVKHRKELEGLLKEDGRNGWRVQHVVGGRAVRQRACGHTGEAGQHPLAANFVN